MLLPGSGVVQWLVRGVGDGGRGLKGRCYNGGGLGKFERELL